MTGWIKRGTFAGSWLHRRESQTISMVFADFLNAYLGSAESAPWLSKDRG
jgi:hypothetical protein